MTNQQPITPPPELVQQWSDAHWRLSMTDQHPITPPLELVQQWSDSSPIQHSDESWAYELFIADQAARWGSDQELDECCAWLPDLPPWSADNLRKHRRPKPQSLNDIALQMLGTIERDAHYLPEITDVIRRALEALPND
jgi:hypothetical protein